MPRTAPQPRGEKRDESRHVVSCIERSVPGRPPGRMDPAAYVLQDFSAEELPAFEEALARAVTTLEIWLDEGIDAAMNYCNAPAD